MAFFGLFKRKNTTPLLTAQQWQDREKLRLETKELDDTRRKLDLEILVEKKKTELLQQQLLTMEVQAEIDENFGYEDAGESIEDKAVQFFEALQGVKNAGAPVTPQNTTTPQNMSSAPADIPLEQLQKTWDSVPDQFKKIAKEKSDDKLKEYLKQKNPNLSEKSLNDAVAIVRSSTS